MIMKTIKIAGLSVAGLAVVGGLLFGGDVMSYMSSSARTVRSAVKDIVPLEFELRRARDLLADVIPEMQANVRLIAQEEVEVEGLRGEIQQCRGSLDQERTRIARTHDMLSTRQASFTLAGGSYSRDQLKEDLARRFERVKEAEMILAGKERLLSTREASLRAAMQTLERTKSQKVRLEDQIAALEGQYRLVKAASVGSQIDFDHSKLAQTEKLITDIRKRLDVAERVLTHEAQFTQPIPIDVVDEKDLLSQVGEYLHGEQTGTAAGPAAVENDDLEDVGASVRPPVDDDALRLSRAER